MSREKNLRFEVERAAELTGVGPARPRSGREMRSRARKGPEIAARPNPSRVSDDTVTTMRGPIGPNLSPLTRLGTGVVARFRTLTGPATRLSHRFATLGSPKATGTILVLMLVLVCAGCSKAKQTTPDVVVVDRPAVTLDPNDPSWNDLPEHIAPLLLQDMVDPRLMEPSTSVVHVQAMTDGKDIAFRLSWDDATMNDMPGPAKFTDACAVQLPQKAEPDLPAPQMGEMGRQVEIAFWRASWQAVVNGRGDTIKDLQPNASVDHYPFEAASLQPGSPEQKEMQQRYSPARATGNTMAGPRERPVECLIAGGPGTLTPDPTLKGNGSGKYEKGKWAVVISRPLPDVLRATPRSQAAFAVWEGSHEEVGARKMRTGWVPVVREQKKS